MEITRKFLQENPNFIFVFGDNCQRRGRGGAAILRDEPNTYGFITKKFPDNRESSFYSPDEYLSVYSIEILKLSLEISNNPQKTYLISKLGAGLANKYFIFELVIEPNLKTVLAMYSNVRFLW